MEYEIIFTIIMLLITVIYNIIFTHKFNKFKSLIFDTYWIINLFIIILFIIYLYIYKKDQIEIQTALKKAIIAFIIAIYAELGLSISPFWTIFIVAYYLSNI